MLISVNAGIFQTDKTESAPCTLHDILIFPFPPQCTFFFPFKTLVSVCIFESLVEPWNAVQQVFVRSSF